LAEAGHDVTLVARGENYTALKNDGLTILTSEGSLKPRVRVTDTLCSVGDSDVAFVTVKARDTERILEDSRHLFKRAVFASFQNSADKDEILLRSVGPSNTIGGVSIVGGTLVRPGVVEYTAAGNTWIGELPNGKSERAEKLAKILNEAHIPTEVAVDITAVKWVKLIQFCAYAGLSALTRLRWHQISIDRNLTEVYIRLVREGASVMKVLGIEPADYKHLIPLKKIVELPNDVLIEEYAKRAKALRERRLIVTVSMLQDVLREKPLEIEETIGYLVNKASELHVEVPTMRIIYSLLRGLQASYLKTS
jgi:2-dehydropantoate 2-reductase